MKWAKELARWEAKVADLTSQSAATPSPLVAQMLSDALNMVRYLKEQSDFNNKRRRTTK